MFILAQYIRTDDKEGQTRWRVMLPTQKQVPISKHINV